MKEERPMSGKIKWVFITIGALVLGLILWAFVFNDGVSYLWDAIRTPINTVYQGITGSSGDVLPAMGAAPGENANLDDQNQFNQF